MDDPAATEIEVFQNLEVFGSHEQLRAFRRNVLANLQRPWRHAKKDEERSKRTWKGDVLALERAATDEAPPARLVLVERDSSYWLSNIVPIEVRELGRARYNAVLRDFLDLIGNAAADKAGVTVELTKPRQDLNDWLSLDAAKALRVFSSSANKSTGLSHPMDRERWYDFIIKAHGHDEKFNTDRLGRWLIEVERWPEDEARDLVGEYEFGSGLLDYLQKQ